MSLCSRPQDPFDTWQLGWHHLLWAASFHLPEQIRDSPTQPTLSQEGLGLLTLGIVFVPDFTDDYPVTRSILENTK